MPTFGLSIIQTYPLKKLTRHLFLILLICCNTTNMWATHIVGGELNYTCLGNNNYEITLVVFRDCFNGVPNFDNPASIGIFGSDNQLITSLGDTINGNGGQLRIALMNDDTLNPVLTDPCLVVPPNVCVNTTTYRDTVNLPQRPGGYLLAYQRCCRNQTIVNIVDPLNSGATYAVNISERALNECNSSAKFNDWPPLYICVNEPIVFDQSAFDIDGDSIVYKMCTPLLGATYSDPIPQPPFNPPYDPINWVEPTYNVDNMLNGFPGGAPLQIDINTGLLTGFPNTIGQFVVGICLEEYRDDELISTTRRDFQYNVGLCGVTVSSFFTPEVVCDETLTVTLDNESENADEFEWYFNDPANPGFFSTEFSPSYSYSDTGTYTIMLIAEPMNQCVDTFWQQINVQYPSLTAEFAIDLVACTDSLTIAVTDLSIDTISTPDSWVWTLSRDFEPIATSTDQNPIFFVENSGILVLELVVMSANGCQNVLQESFEVNLIDEFIEAEEVRICIGSSVGLNPIFNDTYTYVWFPVDGLDNSNSPNPIASPLVTTTYTVEITDSESFCQIEQSITVVVPEPIELTLPNDTTICSTNFWLDAVSPQATSYLWATDPDFDQTIGDSTSVLVTPIGENTYYLLVRDSIGCLKQDSIVITGRGVNVEKEDLQIICEGDSIQLMVDNLDMEDILTYSWSPESLILSGQNTATPTVQPIDPGVYTFLFEVSNQFGCLMIDSVHVGVLDTASQLDFVSAQQCSNFTVNFTNTSVNANFYQWNFGDPTFPDSISTETNPSFTYSNPGTYDVMLTYAADVSCPDTIIKTIVVNNPEIIPDFSWTQEECSDSIILNFMDLSMNTQSTIINWEWHFSNGENSAVQNPNLVVNESGNLDAVLIIRSDDGCIDSILQTIPIELIEVNLDEVQSICAGIPIALNPNPNEQYNYLWTPATGLDDPTAANPMANPSETTTYSVTISDFSSDTCQIVRTVTVMVPMVFELTVTDDQSTCGEAITLLAESMGATSITWSLTPDFSDPLAFTPELEIDANTSNIYYVQASDDFGCSLSDSVAVTDNSIEVASVDQNICSGDTATLRVLNLRPDQVLAYSWSPLNTILIGENTATPLANPETNTTYAVELENQFGCTSTESVGLTVFAGFDDLAIDADPDTIIVGQSSQLTAILDSSFTYNWTPDSTLNDLTIYNPIASPLENTSYFLKVINDDGCDRAATVDVIVIIPECDEPFVFFPNAFSPNGDGENETLKLYGSPIEEAYWAIFNRWGEKIFEAFSAEDEWDGTYKGEQLSPDVFGFYLRVRCIGGQDYFKKGNITLLR